MENANLPDASEVERYHLTSSVSRYERYYRSAKARSEAPGPLYYVHTGQGLGGVKIGPVPEPGTPPGTPFAYWMTA